MVMLPTPSLASPAAAGVAVYWDFENLHASLSEAKWGEGSYGKPDGRFKLQDPLIDVQAVVDQAAAYGPVAVHRAYCNWQFFGRYRDALLQAGMELVQLFPPGSSAKNGADIRLCLDVVSDLARYPQLGTVLVVSGDSDFMPLAQSVKATGRTLIGIGARKTTNRHWAHSCHGFSYYEDLVEASANAAQRFADNPAIQRMARALTVLGDVQGQAWVAIGALASWLRRQEPSFSPVEQGYPTLAAWLEAVPDVVELHTDATGLWIRLR